MRTRSTRFFVVAALVATLGACDIGDGTTLQAPESATTLPPVDTTPLLTEALDDLTLEDPALESAPLPTLDGVVDAGGEFRVFAPWAQDAPIGAIHTCDGANSSPAVSWTNAPGGTQEYAVSLVDETNLSNGRPFIHWVVAGIAPSIDRISGDTTPQGAVRGLNFFGDIGYTGPCPDPGSTNSFTLTVFALGQQLELADGTPAAEMLDLIATVAIGATSSRGTATR
ncbi:MAG: YbhB/YbcL family Raf kinase inhibitor-like protein [Ilumatobacter sp.]